MPLPMYGVEAGGGRIVTLDDNAVVTDLASSAGVGGNTYSPYFVSTPFDAGTGGWSTFRKVVQHVHHDGAVTVVMEPIQDDQDTGQAITRTLALGDSFVTTAPFRAAGTVFSFRVTLSAFDAGAELGKSEQWIVPRRQSR